MQEFTTKKVTLNKAAVMMKRIKVKTNLNLQLIGPVIYPIDAITGRDPENVRKQIAAKIVDAKTIQRETRDTVFLYAQIKEAIINANVKSGLHGVLCQIDMMKNMKTYLEETLKYNAVEVVQSYAQNSRGLQHILVAEEDVTADSIVFEGLVDKIIKDITRQDSKNSYVNTVIDMHIGQDIKDALIQITKDLNELEDKKYEINNTYKIDVMIPESLYDLLGVSK